MKCSKMCTLFCFAVELETQVANKEGYVFVGYMNVWEGGVRQFQRCEAAFV